jgi:hypothetical protein
VRMERKRGNPEFMRWDDGEYLFKHAYVGMYVAVVYV